ncbi:MAG: DNA polymerase III subunit gamma/tau [Alphaproteobacteria bacterium]
MNETVEKSIYRVLARKYRPSTFSELVGQDVMVRTLTNAIEIDRLPHAFILIGVRGVGKTSTARIIARALNCVSIDGTGQATAEPCGVCSHCVAIAEDRHVDVIEMDAASRTGVNDIRELIDGVRYRPLEARYKIYIIDEVHMLSTSAFNALLKTLEEPPEHVKFIFATTETRKVPVTVLSRCQRFDLRRVETGVLIDHFQSIARKEGVTASEESLAMIARAADGSVRDGLSLLDQAVAHAGIQEDGHITEASVRDMLGLADHGRIYDLLEHLLTGKPREAIDELASLYNSGADPLAVIGDLLQIVHWLTRLNLDPGAADSPGYSEIDRTRGVNLAERLNIGTLGRIWQVLLKGNEEVRTAPSAIQAAEMVLIRLTLMSELPPPADLIRMLQTQGASGVSGHSSDSQRLAHQSAPTGQSSRVTPVAPQLVASGGIQALARPEIEKITSEDYNLDSFEAVVALFETKREGLIAAALRGQVNLVSFEHGHISFRAGSEAPHDLANKVARLLKEWTGDQWLVSLSEKPGQPTIRSVRETAARERRNEAIAHPLVQAALEAFPGARVEAVTELTPHEGNFENVLLNPDEEEKEI